MTQCLVFADQAAELLARVDVGGGERKSRFHGADHVGADGGGASGHGGANGCCGACVVGRVAQRFGDRAVEHQLAGGRVIDQAEGANDRIGGIDEEEHEAVFVAGLAAHARAHHEAAGRARVQHERLGAVEAPPVAVAPRAGLDPQRRVAPLRFIVRPGHAQAAIGQGR
ncbi:hypothetical protein D3C87_1225650 [compost metagenome]